MTQMPPPIPMPALPLEYPAPPRDGRPGVITAIGVISIVVASMGLLGNVVAGFYAVGISFAAYAAQRTSVSATIARSSAVSRQQQALAQAFPGATSDDLPAGPRGLSASFRNTIITGMEAARPLNNVEQRERLKQLLAKCGKDAFPFADRPDDGISIPFSSETAQRNVSDSGQFPSPTGGDGPVYYVIGNGKIEVYDDHAVFFPSDGDDRTPVRVAKGVTDDAVARLTAADIDALTARVKSLASGASQVQLDAFKQALSDPEQQIIDVGAGSPAPAAQIRIVSLDPTTGALTIFTTYNGFVVVDKVGTVTDSTAYNAKVLGGFRIRASGVVMAVLDAIGSVLLSIYLLVIGIMVLRQSRRGRKLHLIYAWLKLPLVVLGVIGWVMLINDFAASMSQMAPPGSGPPATSAMAAGFMTVLGVGAVVSLAYPVALLIVLRTRRVKEYYAGVQG